MISVTKRFLGLLKPFRLTVWAAREALHGQTGLGATVVALIIGLSICYIAQGAIFGRMIDELIRDPHSPSISYWLIAWIVVKFTTDILFSRSVFKNRKLEFATRERFHSRYIEKLASFRIDAFNNENVKRLFNDTRDAGVWKTVGFVGRTPWLIQNAFDVVLAGAILAVLDWRITLLLFGGAALQCAVQFANAARLDGVERRLNRRDRVWWAARWNFMEVRGMIMTRGGGIIPRLVRFLRIRQRGLLRVHLNVAYRNFLFELIAIMVASAALVGAVTLFVFQVVQGAHSIGDLTFAVAMTNSLAGALTSFTRNSGAHSADAITVGKMQELLDYKDFLLPVSNSTERKLQPGRAPVISFENVTFHWESGRSPAVNNLSLTIAAGEKVGLVGLNGSGKSTTLLLLSRLIVPQSGAILLDGYPIETFGEDELRSSIGFLPQTHWHQPFSIAQNIALGARRSKFDMNRVRSSANFAAAESFINDKPKGYGYVPNTWAGDGELSGGENQKIGIARLAYQDPPIWILDEPTTAIDAPSRSHIYRRLGELSSATTLLIVTHEIDVLKTFVSRIVVLENGSVVEDGTYDHLSNKVDGRFRNFLLHRELLESENPAT